MTAITLSGGVGVRDSSPGVLLAHPDVDEHIVGRKVRVGWVHPDGCTASALIAGHGASWGQFPIEAIALDLTEEAGRNHATKHLATYYPEKLPMLFDDGAMPCASVGVLWRPELMGGPQCWVLASWNSNYRVTFVDSGRGYMDAVEVPALADLDMNDTTLLPDGSRRVDALALQAACLHHWPVST